MSARRFHIVSAPIDPSGGAVPKPNPAPSDDAFNELPDVAAMPAGHVLDVDGCGRFVIVQAPPIEFVRPRALRLASSQAGLASLAVSPG